MGGIYSGDKSKLLSPMGPTLAKEIYPIDGIQINVLTQFITNMGGRAALEGKTTADICTNFIKPLTLDKRISYCEYIKLQMQNNEIESMENLSGTINHGVGIANVFVSHDVFDALWNYFKDQPDMYIWFDLFSINQHIELNIDSVFSVNQSNLDSHLLSTSFQSILKDIGYTVMVLSKWKNPISLRRTWCIYELYCTAVNGNKFGIAMSKRNEDELIRDILKDKDCFYKVLNDIDIRNSDTSITEVSKKIFDIIECTVGYDNFNSKVLAIIRNWYKTIVKRTTVEETLSQTQKEQDQVLISIKLLVEQGNYKEASNQYEDILDNYIALDGEISVRVASIVSNLAFISYKLGDFKKALDNYERVLRIQRTALGNSHLELLGTYMSIATVYLSQNNHIEALECYQHMLHIRITVLGVDDLQVAETYNNIGIVNYNIDNYELALSNYKQALCIKVSRLGRFHPSLAELYNNIAAVYHLQKKYKDAINYYEEALLIQIKALGENHPHVIITQKNISLVRKTIENCY